MAMTMKDFLNLYFRQLHFNAMPDAVRSQFDDYVAANSFRGDMKSWRDDLLKKDADGKPYKLKDAKGRATGHYVANDLPGADAMDEDGWKQLYKTLWRVFDIMDANRESLDKKTKTILDNFFGKNKVFEPIELDEPTRQSVRVFFDNILDTKNQEEYDEMFSLFKRYTGNEDDIETSDFDKFKEAIQDGSYERKPEVRQKLRKFVENLKYQYGNSFFNSEEEDPTSKKIRGAMSTLNAIETGFAKKQEPTNDNITKLKDNIEKILTSVHKESKIADDVRKYDKGKISDQLDAAIKKTDYTGKITEDDFVPEKRQDKKNIFQRASEKINDFYDNWLKKYVTAHRDHIYKIPTAKAISEAIIAEKIKPTDGIQAILDNKDKIYKRLQNKIPLESLGQFKWFVSKIEQLQNGKMKEAVEGALREGPKIRKLVEALALDAIEETNGGKNRIEDAKAAMEVLTVMRYGTFTSRRLDNLRGTNVEIASDKSVDWNKDEGINTVAKGLDKTLKFGLVIAGAGVTAFVNRVRRIGGRFRHSGELQKRHEEWQAQNQIDQDAAKAAKEEQDKADDEAIEEKKEILFSTRIYDDDDLKFEKEELERKKEAESEAKTEEDAAREAYGAALQIKKDYDDRNNYIEKRNELEQLKQEIEAVLKSKPDVLDNQLERVQIEEKINEYKKVLDDLKSYNGKIDEINRKYSGKLDAEYAKITTPDPTTGETLLKQLEDDWTAKRNAYNEAKADKEDLQKRISDYESAKADIDMYEEAKKKRTEDYDKWDDEHHDYYVELMGFWDFLQTGKTKSLFNLGRKRIQKRYDKVRSDGKTKMDHVYEKWIHRHGYDK